MAVVVSAAAGTVVVVDAAAEVFRLPADSSDLETGEPWDLLVWTCLMTKVFTPGHCEVL